MMSIELAPARIRSSKGSAVDLRVAESTGLEPATSAVTGQRSNQLSYDSNPRKAKLEPIAKPFNHKMAQRDRRLDLPGSRSLNSVLHQELDRFFDLQIFAFSDALGVVSHFD